ncbi:hypothetical protein [Azospirillum sp.]|uniref:hypothetical protein n=1 Tax=Azospirillum sp. TaxID=34012 RepID=UPI002D22BC49|nr:hypothetical protein [Azospirillum sp.]HYD66060.1 hypothetical protein [Azospirillum sp.]
MHKTLLRPLLHLGVAALSLAAGHAHAATLGDRVTLNPQPIPPGNLSAGALTGIRKPIPPVCLSCPSVGSFTPGEKQMLNPQPLPPRWLLAPR